MDLNQIRINDLARELEVAARAIIAYLPEAGVKGKRTHSSSIDLETANKVRQHFRKLLEKEEAAETKAQAEHAAKFTAVRSARPEPSAAPTVANPAQTKVTFQAEHAAKLTPVSAARTEPPAAPTVANQTQMLVAAISTRVEVAVKSKPLVHSNRSASKRWAAALGELRRLMMDLLDEVGPRHPKETAASQISRLREARKVPEHIAALMQTLLKIRNIAEYNSGFVPTATVAAVLRAISVAISEWAMAQGSAYTAEFQEWKPPA